MAIQQGLDNKISNIIGTKLPHWLLRQLETRSNQNTQDSRNNNNLLYLANKSAWVRLVSSVDISKEDLDYFKNQLNKILPASSQIQNESDIAKQYILFGGTSKYLNNNSYDLRSGFGNDKAYGLLGETEVQKYGYKPMPGITSVNIETQGRLGSIRAAVINFKCWDKSQLDIIDALYFKLGFTMFLEWGHTYFYPSEAKTVGGNITLDPTKVTSTEFFSIDPFEQGLNKEDILIKISQNSRDSEGNYDAMLGIVTNFNFSYNQDGGYDCTLRIMGLGVLAEGIKINNPGVLPGILQEEIVELTLTLDRIQRAIEARKKATSGVGGSEVKKPDDIMSYPDCVKNISKATLTDTKPQNGKPAPFYNKAILAYVNGTSYYFYYDGRYQTTGLTANGTYDCRNGVLFIDGKSTIPSVFTYAQVINTNKNNIRYETSLQEAYYLLQNTQQYQYFAIDKVKNLLPLNSGREIKAFLNINNIQKLPSFTANNFGIIDLLVNGVTRGNKLTIPLQSTDYKGGTFLNYFAPYTLQPGTLGNNDYKVEIRYNGIKPNVYTIKLEYDYYAIVPGILTNIFGLPIDGKTPATAQDIQDEIKKYIVDPKTEWRLTEVSDSQYSTQTNNDVKNTFVAETIVKINRTIQKKVQTGTDPSGNPIYSTQPGSITWELPITLTFNDLSILDLFGITDKTNIISPIDAIEIKSAVPPPPAAQPPAGSTTTKGSAPLTRDAAREQVTNALNLQSALEITLRTIQVHALNRAIKLNKDDLDIGKKVFVNNFWSDTIGKKKESFLKALFSNGVFSSFLDELIGNSILDTNYTTKQKMIDLERFKIHSKYGFATNLMANKADITELVGREVKYTDLLRAFVVPYQINQEIIKGTSTNHPVYIQLGLLLMLLNHCCTIYDTKTNDFQTPLVYIDFNPELNFFLTNTKQLSTNPWIVLIPFEGGFEDYKQLFDLDILNAKKNAIQPQSNSKQETKLFNPETQDVLSGQLPKIKEDRLENNLYRGKLMNILLSIDHVVGLVQQYSTKDSVNSVYLKPFLEQLLSDINKHLGNFNALRLSYSDAANTFQIVDDQFIPALSPEDQISAKENKVNPDNRTELPLVGKNSIAKSVEIKTEVVSKLANMLAISANADVPNKSTLSTNGSSYGYINQNYIDRYIKNRQEITGSGVKVTDTIKTSAGQFNQAISDFYSKVNPSETNVPHATNYYIEKMSKIKNEDYPTRASQMIPVSVNFTTDGVAGMAMGQSFTIPDELLPYTYSTTKKLDGIPRDHLNNVGFVMVGLNHSIDNNTWNTSVKANMIFLKDKTEFKGEVISVSGRSGVFGINSTGKGSSCPDLIALYKGAGPDYSCAPQVLPPEYIGTDNFNKYYPGYVFKKGTSDINLGKANLSPLAEKDITDITKQNRFKLGTIPSDPTNRYFIVHHTAGTKRVGAGPTIDTFYSRGLPVHYVIDKNGTIYRFLPDGAIGYHAPPYNSNSIGVEIAAANNADVDQVQINAAVRLIHYLGFKRDQVKGHGEVSDYKSPDEGQKVVNLIKTLI